jgi:hypothetical protein
MFHSAQESSGPGVKVVSPAAVPGQVEEGSPDTPSSGWGF